MRRTSIFKSVFAFVMMIILVLGSTISFRATSRTYDNGERPYEIAVAYDNSGSMYNNANWCYAKYAMEIFASMMDLTGRDTLTVFTMHDVKFDGVSATKQIDVKSVADIDKIHKMTSLTALGNTPFSVVESAASYLQNGADSGKKERWLIILTDGAFDGLNADQLKSKIKAIADGQNINVQYIPFGGTVLSDDNANDNFHASPNIAGNNALRNELVAVCNKIFQRDALSNRLSGQTLTIDLSMKRIIVFVQGKNASITALKDSSGNPVQVLMDSGKRSYSEYSFGYNNLPVPEEVKGQIGQVVTFGACVSGTYTLEHANADILQIFYEPDVTMQIEFINADGVVEDFSDGQVLAGEYTFRAKLIDRVTGADVSGHELMGGDVQIGATITYDNKNVVKVKNGDKIELQQWDDVKFEVVATYLERYKITDEDCPDIPDLSCIDIIKAAPKLTVKANVKQNNDWYVLSNHKDWKPIRLDLKLDGQPLTDEQLENAVIDITFDGPDKNIAYTTELLYGESAVNVYIGTDDTGKYIAPKTGSYDFKASAKVEDPYGNEASGSAKADFAVQAYSFGIKVLFWIIVILLIIALILFLLSIPAMPRKIYVISTAENLVPGATALSTTHHIKANEAGRGYSVRGVNGCCTSNTVYKIKISKPDTDYWGLQNCSWVNSRGIYLGSLCLKRPKPVRVNFTVDRIGNAPGMIQPDPTVSEGQSVTADSTSYAWTEILENDGITKHLHANVEFRVNVN